LRLESLLKISAPGEEFLNRLEFRLQLVHKGQAEAVSIQLNHGWTLINLARLTPQPQGLTADKRG
jgi:hypothetical protein